jgi:hypothetical protein
MTGRDYRLGKLSLVDRATRIDEERVRKLQAAGAGKDKRTEQEYAAALARETEASLRRSASWCAGQPLLEAERWPTVTSADLGGRGERPDKGRWA